MKKAISLILCFIMLLTSVSYAVGDPNMDGDGGGNLGGGTGKNYWVSGDDGVRVTVVLKSTATPMTTPVDFSNKDQSGVEVHFGKRSKLNYQGSSLKINLSKYFSVIPDVSLPKIISGSGSNNISAGVKWRTPKEPQVMNIRTSCSLGSVSKANITANIIELKETTPPDPKFHDRNDSFTLKKAPKKDSLKAAEWGKWSAVWIPPTPISPGYWKYTYNEYSAALTYDYRLVPDSRCGTAVDLGYDNWEMKSGYGVNVNIDVNVGTTGNGDDITFAQSGTAEFCKFDFKTYNRLLMTKDKNKSKQIWTFKSNTYSYYKNKVHFTPLWYPDNTYYVIKTTIFDVWTPKGQLYAEGFDKIYIRGNVFDDWYIKPERVK